jgi:hypothetical protein
VRPPEIRLLSGEFAIVVGYIPLHRFNLKTTGNVPDSQKADQLRQFIGSN